MTGALRATVSSLAFVSAMSLSAGCFSDDGRGNASASGTSDTIVNTTNDANSTSQTGSNSGGTSEGSTDSSPSSGNETSETTDEPSTTFFFYFKETTDFYNTTKPVTTSDTTTSSERDDSSTTMDIACQDSNLADCNGDDGDGCETNLGESLGHCGACNNPCEGICIQGQCKPGKLVFLTSKTYTGDLGGIMGADEECTNTAASVNLPGPYKAWLSGDAQDDPESRFTPAEKPYLLVNGQAIAANWADLVDGTLENPINIDEHGNTIQGNNPCVSTQVWTNTEANSFGFVDLRNCGGWNAAQPNMIGRVGLAAATDSQWSDEACDDSYAYCNVPRHLYCFGQ